MRKVLGTVSGRIWLALLLVLAAVVIVYAPGLDAPFYFDDWPYLVSDPAIRIERLDLESLYRAGAEFPHPGRPVVAMTFALDYYFHGLYPSGFRYVNIVIHLLNGVLVYGFINLTLRTPALRGRILQPQWLALVVALLWLLHPLQIQSVTYIWQRTNALAALFYLLAFIAYVRGRFAITLPRRLLYWAGAALSWFLALGSKELAAPLPLFLLLYEWFFFQDLSRAWVRRGSPWFVLGGLLGIYLLWNSVGTDPLLVLERGYAMRDFNPLERILTEWRVVVFYLGLLAFPVPGRLAMEHDFSISQSLLVPLTTLGAGLFLLCLLLIAVASARRSRLLAFGILWFLGHLAIESTIIPLEFAFEYRVYLPSIGPILIVVLGLWQLRLNLAAKAAVIVSLGLLLGSWTYERNQLWAQEIPFWEDTVAKAPGHSRTHVSLAWALQRSGRSTEAEEAYSEVILMFEDGLERPIRSRKNAFHAYMRRAELRLERGNRAGAREDLIALSKLGLHSYTKPVLTVIVAHLQQRAGLLDMATEQYSWVIKKFEWKKAPSLDWRNQAILAYNNRGAIRFVQGDIQGAMEDVDQALLLAPELENAKILKMKVQALLD